VSRQRTDGAGTRQLPCSPGQLRGDQRAQLGDSSEIGLAGQQYHRAGCPGYDPCREHALTGSAVTVRHARQSP
jgi:hypothetical protein